ncbi:hypothetical protein [Pedobacter gandavensis]|uniref:hypothetical protein n=1 Tax=Pedobacter gandavensis TaxID=2679963 RepID=UPI002930CE5B|nr:hypothetical protein [Pedobacter gandavensis]
MENTPDKRFKLAAYLIFGSIIIDLIAGILQSHKNPDFEIGIGLETSLLFITLGYFAFIGKHWVKWVLLFVTVLSTLPLLTMPDQQLGTNTTIFLQLFSGFLKFTAVLLLFLSPKAGK